MTKDECTREAERVEAHAADSQQAWLLSGHSDKYSAAMDRARKLRHAATLRTPTERKQYLA